MKEIKKGNITFYFVEKDIDIKKLPKKVDLCSSFSEYGKAIRDKTKVEILKRRIIKINRGKNK